MSHQFYAARWQNHPARRVGQAHMLRILRATVGEDHPDYRDLEARRQIRYADTDETARTTGYDDSGD